MIRQTIVRSTLVVAAALAAISGTGLADVASAATPRTVSVTTRQPLPMTGATATAAKSKSYGAKDAFSAGIAGYDDATCAGLLDDYNNAVDADGAALGSGDYAAADRYGELADRIYGQLTDNCAVIN
jgi:hypothetical protein